MFMPIFTTDECFGCEAPIEPAAGNFYCGPCVVKQEAEEEAERKAFDQFHAFADGLRHADSPAT